MILHLVTLFVLQVIWNNLLLCLVKWRYCYFLRCIASILISSLLGGKGRATYTEAINTVAMLHAPTKKHRPTCIFNDYAISRAFLRHTWTSVSLCMLGVVWSGSLQSTDHKKAEGHSQTTQRLSSVTLSCHHVSVCMYRSSAGLDLVAGQHGTRDIVLQMLWVSLCHVFVVFYKY